MTGLRRGEVLGLKWDDVDLETGRVPVRQVFTKKDGEAWHPELVSRFFPP
jgi:integrase